MKLFGSINKKAIFISPEFVLWGEIRTGKSKPELISCDFKALPEGLVNPHFGKENISDKKILREIIEEVLPTGKRKGNIALTLPDSVARITVLDFDQLPSKKEEVEKLISWRIKKTIPIAPEDVKLVYAVLSADENGAEVITSIASRGVIREYEDLLRGIGLRPVLVDIATLNSMNVFAGMLQDLSLFVNLTERNVGMALRSKGIVRFFRSKEIDVKKGKVVKEVLSTLTYIKSTFPSIGVDSIFIHSVLKEAEQITEELKKDFAGSVVRLNMTDFVTIGGEKRDESVLSPLIGGALRL